MRARAVLLLAALLLGSTGAQADTVTIDFDLSGSQVSLFNGLVEVPPDGVIDPASALTLTFPSDGATVLPGPSRLSDLSLGGDFEKVLGEASFEGSVSAVQFGQANAFLSDSRDDVSLGTIFADVELFIDCSGPDCSSFGDFPFEMDGLQAFPGGNLALEDVDTAGEARLSGELFVQLPVASARVSVVGIETGRQVSLDPEPPGGAVVPEPGGAVLFAAGLWLQLRTLGRGRASRRRG